MKKNITILVALFLVFNATAQNTEQVNDYMESRASKNNEENVSLKAFQISEDVFLNDSTLWYDFTSPTDSIPDSRSDNTFDAAGNRTLGLASKWDDALNDWVGDVKSIYVYEDGEYVTYINADYDATSNEYVNDYKKMYTNNEAGFAEIALYYDWDASGDDWKSTPSDKKEFTYDTYNNLIEETYFEATGVDEYVKTKQYQNTYDVDGNQTVEFYVKWDSDISDWTNYKEYSWVFDDSGYMIEYYYKKWDSDEGSFYEYKKELYENDANGNRTKRTYLKYDSGTSDYYETDKFEYTVDENGNTVLANQYDFDEDWVFVSRGFYAFSKLTVGVNSLNAEQEGFRFYPNPAKDFIQIDLNGANSANLFVYSISGQLLIEKNINQSGNKISVANFPSGVYFIKIDNGITTESKKLVIE